MLLPLPVVLLAALSLPAAADPHPGEVAGDEVLAELAEGRHAAAIRGIRQALGATEDEGEAAALRCLLGRSLRLAGQEAEAVDVLAEVPLTADCGRQAAFDRADALLALDRQAEAAALYAAAGERALGDDRDAALAAEVGALADRIRAGREGRVRSAAEQARARQQARRLRRLALDLELSEGLRLQLAEEAGAELLADHRAHGDWDGSLGRRAGDVIVDTLRSAVLDAERAAGLRRLAARLHRDAAAWALLRELPDDRPTLVARAEVALALDAEVGLHHLEAAVQALPEDRWLRDRLATRLLSEQRHAEALPHLEVLAEGEDEAAEAARLALPRARAALESDPTAAAEVLAAGLDAWLTAHPVHSERAAVESARDDARLQAGLLTEDLAALQRLADSRRGAPVGDEALWSLGALQAAAGEGEAARVAWEALLARTSDRDLARRALRALALQRVEGDDGGEAALSWLHEQAEAGRWTGEAEGVREALQAASLTVEVPERLSPRGKPTVVVHSRNLDDVRVRLHRIDAEGFLRATGGGGSLDDLDVGVVAPDEEWTVSVPEARPLARQRWELPLKTSGPGFYAVTVSGPEIEAQALALVSDASLVARARGKDLVAGVIRDGRPVSGARVLVAHGSAGSGGRISEARTGRDGLARLEVEEGAATVITVGPAGPAMVRVDWDAGSHPEPRPELQVDLDQPAWRAGEAVNFRVAGRVGEAPITGEWEVWLRTGPVDHPGLRLRADRYGALVGALTMPPVDVPGRGQARAAATLMARPVGEEEAHSLTSLQLVEAPAPRRSLRIEEEDADHAVLIVTEADGSPAAGAAVQVRIDDEEVDVHRVDETGRLSLAAPLSGQPWALSAGLVGDGSWEEQRLGAAAAERIQLWLPEERIAEGAPLTAVLSGPAGAGVEVGLFARGGPHVPAGLPDDPAEPALDATAIDATSWTGSHPDRERPRTWALEGWQPVTLSEDGRAEITLPPHAAGSWELRARAIDPALGAARRGLEVGAEGPAVGAVARVVAAGSRLSTTATGPALVTLEGDGIVAAQLVAAGQRSLSLDLPWADGPQDLVATGPDGRAHARSLEIEAELDVALEVEPVAGGGYQAIARVTGPDGRPVRAQVALSAVDVRHSLPLHTGLLSRSWDRPYDHSSAGAAHSAHRRVAFHRAVSQALLAEAAREREAEKARDLGGRLLGSGELDDVLAETTGGLGGLGTRGTGMGGGGAGYGRGAGVLGAKAGHARRASTRTVGPTALDAWTWTVAETGADGVLRVPLADPEVVSRWRLQAVALHPHAVGRDEAEVDVGARAWVAGPGALAVGPEGAVTPVLHLVAGASDEAFQLEVDGSSEEILVPAGQGIRRALPALPAGASLTARVRRADGSVAWSGTLSPELLPGRPDVEGARAHVYVGPGGSPPVGALALAQPAERRVPGAAADTAARISRGRAALAALPRSTGAERAALLDAVRLAVAGWRTSDGVGSDALPRAEALALLSRAAEALPALGITRGELDRAAEGIEAAARSSDEAVAVTWALAVAGRPVDASRLGRLLRDADQLSDETAGLLARALVALDREAEARPLVRGDGVQATLARVALGARGTMGADARSALPLPGTPARAHYVEALAAEPRSRGQGGAVTLDGAVVAALPAEGGVISLAVPPGAEIAVQGAPGAVLSRSSLASGTRPVRAVRVPRSEAGAPLGLSPRSLLDDRVADCGAEGCALVVGDGLALAGAVRTDDIALPAGLAWDDRALLRAVAPGRYQLTGLEEWVDGAAVPLAPLVIEVSAGSAPPEPGTLHPAAAVGLAQQAATVGADPLPWLSPWPGFDDWRADLRAPVMGLRFDAARKGSDPAALVVAFEALRDADPGASLALDDVAAVASAYAASGRPDRAVDAWRAGLGAAFLAEVGEARSLEDVSGPLVALRSQRQVAQRYPSVRVVDEAAFHLPEQLAALAEDGVPADLAAEGITPTDVRLLAAAWDREFLALHPGSDFVPEAGFHLAQGLLRLRAWEEAATWADRVADAAPDAPVLDGLRYVEGLALSELGRTTAAGRVFRDLSTGQWPQPDGSLGPAGLRQDARYALARIAEAEGRLDAARDGYREVAGSFPDAGRALSALEQVALSPEPLVLLDPTDAAVLPVEAANVERVFLRAYAVDLRTVFLRDGGLDRVEEIQVAGVSPAWSGDRRVAIGPFPEARSLALPLAGTGAWLVELDAEGAEARALVVRSPLRVDTLDADGARRVTVRRDGAPAAGVEIRALGGGGGVVAVRTDLRGVATVPMGAPVLAFDGQAVAFTEPGPTPVPLPSAYDFQGQAGEGALLRNLDQRVLQQRQRNARGYEQTYRRKAEAAVEASAL